MHQVIITVEPDGVTRVKAEGFQGPSCSLVTRPFIEALGVPIQETPTEEMYQQPAQNEQELKQ